jgi:hypothetical protein
MLIQGNIKWYRNYVLKCMPYVKFIIDRGDGKKKYAEVLKGILLFYENKLINRKL